VTVIVYMNYGDTILNTFLMKNGQQRVCWCLTKVREKRSLLNFPKSGYLAIALLLRLSIAPFLSHPFDERVFMAVGASVAKGVTPYGQYILQNIFASTPHPDLYGTIPGIGYPPPWGLICGGMYLLSSLLAPNNLYAYVLALKLPVIAAEMALAVLVFKIIEQEINEKVAFKAFLLFLFCPFLITVGTIWGMFDTLALFFVLLSAYTLHNNWKASALFLSVASVLKLFPLALVPLYAMLLYKSGKKIGRAISFLTLVSALTAFFTFIPMIVYNWPLSNMYNALGYHLGAVDNSYGSQSTFPYGAASPFNVFTLFSNYVNGAIQPPWISVYLWIPACAAVYLLFWRIYPSKQTDFDFRFTIQWSLLVMLTFFTTRMWVSEQNLIFLFAFFALTVILIGLDLSKVHILWIMLLSFVIVHVPAISFLWMPYPWTLNSASSFASGPLGWTRLLMMTMLTLSWLVLSWHFVARKLRWRT